MRATALEFRLRMIIMTVLIALGFWSPWIEAGGIGRRISLLEWLPLELSRLGLLRFTVASPVVIVAGALIAALGAVLRVWGAACLGFDTVHHGQMQAGAVMAGGPYRYVRNPLYLGGWCMMAAMAFIMPPTGALFAIPLLTVFLLRLILGEESYLSRELGEPYKAYLRAVPRLWPRFPSSLPPASIKPRWVVALLTEVNPIGVFITLAILSWNYDQVLMLKVILVSFGISLVVRALMPGRLASSQAAK